MAAFLRTTKGTFMSRLFLITLLLLSFTLVTSAEEKAKPSPAEIKRLIKQLGSDGFTEREAASKRLEDIGEPAFEDLQKVAIDSADAEVRRRAKMLIQAILPRLYRELRCFNGHTDSICAVAFSPDGKQAVSASADMTMRL